MNKFQILLYILILNIIFLILFMRNVNSPVFINGNIIIINFNLFLIIFFFISKIIYSKKSKIKSKFSKIDSYTITSSVLIGLLSSILFWSLGPTIIDRSISVSILDILNQSDIPLDSKTIAEKFSKNYLSNNYQIDKRLDEQIYLSNINKISRDFYSINKKGKKIAKINRFISNLFNLDKSFFIE